jgi:DNA-binding GntR family transcriptional regulator
MPVSSRRSAATSRTRQTPAIAPVVAAGAAPIDDGGDGDGRLDNVSRAYQELRRIIVWGQLPPGSRISERIVADRLGLSRTPVRSALHRLEQEGFVASVGRDRERRLIVAPLTMDDGQEVYAIVGHLEGLAARTAASLPPARRKEIVAKLRAVNGELAEQARRGGDAAHFFDLDIEFHRSYVEGVVGPRLLTLHRAIKPQSDRYSRLYVSVLLGQVATSVREHEAITKSIARGDPDAAQRAAEMNWSNASERLSRVIALHGERGSWEAWGGEPGSGTLGSDGAGASPAPSARAVRKPRVVAKKSRSR